MWLGKQEITNQCACLRTQTEYRRKFFFKYRYKYRNILRRLSRWIFLMPVSPRTYGLSATSSIVPFKRPRRINIEEKGKENGANTELQQRSHTVQLNRHTQFPWMLRRNYIRRDFLEQTTLPRASFTFTLGSTRHSQEQKNALCY